MKITIKATEKLWQVQKEFHELFPHLRLELYLDPERNKDHELIQLHRTLAETGHVNDDAYLSLSGYEPAAIFEKDFMSTFGLHAKVFMKEGIHWRAVPQTEMLPLGDINRQCVAVS